jgi:sugar phosphate isomerase/epimerase
MSDWRLTCHCELTWCTTDYEVFVEEEQGKSAIWAEMNPSENGNRLLAPGSWQRRRTVSARRVYKRRKTVKIGLYSITYLGVWYNGPGLSLFELIDRARHFGYDGIEIDGKRPHGNPLDMPTSRCREVRQKAQDSGLDIYAVAANNDFSSPIPEHRECQLALVRDLIRMTADLGAPCLRLFAAWPGVTKTEDGGCYDISKRLWKLAHEEFTQEQTWDWCREGMIEASRWAADAGIVLALQNHAPVTNNYADMLRMIHEVASPSLKACFDAPLAHDQGVINMHEAAAQVGSLQALTHFGGEYEEGADGEALCFVRERDGGLTPENFYVDFAVAMREIGYTGYTGFELCHPLPRVNGRTVGMDFVDKNARLAAQFMRQVLAEAL